MWNDVITGLTFGAVVYLLFLAGHFAGVLLYWRQTDADQEQPK